MDLLSQRYASPFFMLDEFIRIGQFHSFVIELVKTISEEKIHNARWEYYLHKVYDMTFDEYVAYCEQSMKQDQEMSYEDIGNVINESKNMLEGFVPE